MAGALLMVGCGSAESGASGQGERAEVVVAAAASLTDAFGAIEDAFEATTPDVDIVLNLAASTTLREQVLGGAPVDVLATADTTTMDVLVDTGDVAHPTVFATNHPVIAVARGNPLGLSGLGDFADEALFLGLCAPEVPCGSLARQALDRAGVTPQPDTIEPNVRALLAKVAQGELDAAITYATDVPAADGAVEALTMPPGLAGTTSYPIAVLADSRHPQAARAFVEFVQSNAGRDLLEAHGFGPP